MTRETRWTAESSLELQVAVRRIRRDCREHSIAKRRRWCALSDEHLSVSLILFRWIRTRAQCTEKSVLLNRKRFKSSIEANKVGHLRRSACDKDNGRVRGTDGSAG